MVDNFVLFFLIVANPFDCTNRLDILLVIKYKVRNKLSLILTKGN